MKAQEQRAELNRKIIEDREARVREQVEEKKRKKAIEIKENRLRAEKKINVRKVYSQNAFSSLSECST